uniref:Uncharacterized protein n=1 Tax=Magnetococcus massalia (strain MO-1) TaxID=451514 RepID=A0A1S7LHB0_MAGMO|nr:Protein of unknown function [Candidatus Magnetococcus massalia]
MFFGLFGDDSDDDAPSHSKEDLLKDVESRFIQSAVDMGELRRADNPYDGSNRTRDQIKASQQWHEAGGGKERFEKALNSVEESWKHETIKPLPADTMLSAGTDDADKPYYNYNIQWQEREVPGRRGPVKKHFAKFTVDGKQVAWQDKNHNIKTIPELDGKLTTSNVQGVYDEIKMLYNQKKFLHPGKAKYRKQKPLEGAALAKASMQGITPGVDSQGYAVVGLEGKILAKKRPDGDWDNLYTGERVSAEKGDNNPRYFYQQKVERDSAEQIKDIALSVTSVGAGAAGLLFSGPPGWAATGIGVGADGMSYYRSEDVGQLAPIASSSAATLIEENPKVFGGRHAPAVKYGPPSLKLLGLGLSRYNSLK